MSDQRNLILAIALSLVVLLSFQYFYEPTPVSQQETQQTPSDTTPQATAPAPSTGTAPGAPPRIAPAAVDLAATRRAALEQTPRLIIENSRLHGSIPTVGRRIDDLILLGYKETLAADSPDITFLSPTGTTLPYYAEFGWAAGTSDLATPDETTQWQVSGDRLSPDRPVTLRWDNGQGLRFTRIYALDENYMFTVTQRVENRGDATVTLNPWGLISRTGTPDTLGFYILHEGPIGVLGGALQEIDYDDLQSDDPKENPRTFKSRGGWLGITDKYWLAALVPDQEQDFAGRFQHFLVQQTDKYQIDYLGQQVTLQPGGTTETTNRLFAGAKEVRLLDSYEERYGIALFDRAVDFGWFYFLTKPFFYVIDYFNKLLGNFGLAILLFTVVVKLIFFPLANKSYKAMSKMKALQPEMTKLRERHGDDRQKLNQDMMKLYKEQKVNPASGCLPIVIQIPVFFALYKVLFVTIEMRHAPFFGWIHDLSAPDPLVIFNLFGLIPWDPPRFLMIGIWPIFMGISMFLQQRLNPQPADPIQAKVFMFMPLFFTFLLGSFPAGLVIYWTWNNILSMAQQYVIMKRMGVPIGNKPKKGT